MTTRKNDIQRIADELAKLAGPSSEYTGTARPNPQRMAAKTLIRRTLTFAVASTLANGTTDITLTNSPAQIRAPYAGRVLGARFNPAGAATANDTNYATVALQKTGAVVMASQTTKITGGSGNVVAGTSVPLTLSATLANQRFAKGNMLAPTVTQTASGVATPGGTLQVEVELEGPIDDFGV